MGFQEEAGMATRKTSRSKTKKLGRTTSILGDAGWIEIFASLTMARLLAILLTHADKTFYQKELAEALDTGLYTVQRELARLEKAGLVMRMPSGNRVYYKTNRNHPAFEDLKRVIVKTLGLGRALREALAPLSDRVRVAFIYGSFACGEETEESDMDLLLVGDLSLRDASAVLGAAGRELGREFNAVVYLPDEFKTKVAKGHHFATEVLKGKKIYLIGDEREIEKIIK